MVSLELEARLDNLLSKAQAETKDVDLFAPIPKREECPICIIPLPLNDHEVVFMSSCCGKRVCMGCIHQNISTEIKNKGKQRSRAEMKCAFCRQSPSSGQQTIKVLKKLMKKNIPQAFMDMAERYRDGEEVFQSDTKSLEMRIRAAEVGHANGYMHIGKHYSQGTAVVQDESKALAFYEVAAKKGSVYAHQHLALFRGRNGDIQTSIAHMKVAACAGDQQSMDRLMKLYKEKVVSKDDLTQTLRAFQASNKEVQSKDRVVARLLEEARRKGEDPPFHLLGINDLM